MPTASLRFLQRHRERACCADLYVARAVNNELAGDSVYKEMVRTLGLVDLSRLGCVELTGNALLLPPEKAAEAWPDKQANLRFTSYGTLFFDEKTNGRLL